MPVVHSVPRIRLLKDFLIPHLDRQTFREKLIWINRGEGIFRIFWRHQSSSRWSERDCCVFREWAVVKNLWDSNDKKAPTRAKQRLRAALLKLRHVCHVRTEHEFRVYKINYECHPLGYQYEDDIQESDISFDSDTSLDDELNMRFIDELLNTDIFRITT